MIKSNGLFVSNILLNKYSYDKKTFLKPSINQCCNKGRKNENKKDDSHEKTGKKWGLKKNPEICYKHAPKKKIYHN